ncbi:MAG: GDSL-type esterase/lipase family protein [Deltaproteobacteria bacterium]
MPDAVASPLPRVTALLLLVGSSLITILTGCSDSKSDSSSDTPSASSSSADGAAASGRTSVAPPAACPWCSDRRLRANEGTQRSLIAAPGFALAREPRLLEEKVTGQQTKPSSVLGLLPEPAATPAVAETWVSAWGGRGPLSTTITTDRTLEDPVPDLSGRTLRLMAHLTTGGNQVRVRFSQRFSSSTLDVGAAHLAVRSSGSAIVPATDRALTFDGASSVAVPAGADVWSDPINLAVVAGDDLAISVYVPGAFIPTTQGGRGQLKTSYHQPGNQVSAASLTQAQTTRRVFVAYEVQVLSPDPAATIVTLGDSITEGACSTLDANGDWPDLLSKRLPALRDGTRLAVFNAGIGSGRFASSDGAGVRGLSRLDELLVLPNLASVLILMGVNDISYEHVDAVFLQDAYVQAILAAHEAGTRIIGIPILPFGGSSKDVGENVQVAREVNDWMRAHDKLRGASEPSFDAVIDLEDVVKDPMDPGWALRPSLTCDGVHPNQAGYDAIANAFPLDVFDEAAPSSGPPDAGVSLATRASGR